MSSATASVLIIGLGAIGSALAAQMKSVGLRVFYAGRQSNIESALTLKVRLDVGEESLVQEIAASRPADLRQVAVVIIAVKAFDLHEALFSTLAAVATDIPANTVIIPVSNGSVEPLLVEASKAMPQFLWRQGICTFGVTKIGAGHYAMRSKAGRMLWGPRVAPTAASVVELQMAKAELCAFEPAIEPLVRRKWLMNTVLNSLTAVNAYRRNGDVLQNEPELKAVFAEGVELGQKAFGPWTETSEALYQGLLALIKDTENNENSTARDRRLGLETETKFLAGLAELEPSRFPKLIAMHRQLSEKKISGALQKEDTRD